VSPQQSALIRHGGTFPIEAITMTVIALYGILHKQVLRALSAEASTEFSQVAFIFSLAANCANRPELDGNKELLHVMGHGTCFSSRDDTELEAHGCYVNASMGLYPKGRSKVLVSFTLQLSQHGPGEHSASLFSLQVTASQHGSEFAQSSALPQSQSSPWSTTPLPQRPNSAI
jgi:hypothetical protein